MPVDVSFYNSQQPPNIMAGLGSTVGVANELTRNRMLQSEYGARQAIGNAFQQSIDPQTGLPDTAAIGEAIRNNPAAAYAAPEALQANANLQSTSLANAAAGSANTQAYRANVATALKSLAGSNATAKGVRGAISSLVSEGSIPSTFGAQLATEAPTNDKEIPGWIDERFGAALTPGQQAQPVDSGYNPQTLETNTAPLTDYLKKAAQNGGAVAKSPPPGVSDAVAANRAEYVKDQQAAYPILQNAIPLQNALPLISKLSHFNFGPGSQELAQLKAGLQFAGIIPQGSSAADATSMRQEVNKYLHQYANGAVGAERSDAGLAQALSSNPNIDLTQDANLALIKSQVGRDFMTAARPLNYSGDTGSYLNYKSRYAQQNDPRAFVWNYYSPQERRQIIDEMGGENSAAYKTFKQSYGNAVNAGIVPRTSAPATTQGAQ